MPGEEQLEHFLEQARRSGLAQQVGKARQWLGGGAVDLEIELGRQAHGTQHAHRIFAVALLRVADQTHAPGHHVLEAAGVVTHREILDSVIQGVAGEVATDRVILDAAVDVVSHQHAVLDLAVAAAVIAVGAERGHLDDLAAEHHVRQAEAPADEPAVAEQLLDLFGRGVGGDVEIFGASIDQKVAHGASYQIGTKSGLTQAIQHA
ncbi:hypothetical protein D3C71_1488490 [compost metagenome]